MTLVRLICLTGQDRFIPATGQTAIHGHQLQVDDAVAGVAPSGEPGDDGYHPGSGLLAQPDVWAPVKSSKTKKDGEA